MTNYYVTLRSRSAAMRIENSAFAKLCSDLTEYVQVHDALQVLRSGIEHSIYGFSVTKLGAN